MPEGIVSFPFSAIYGADEIKKAIVCAALEPEIRTVLIRGPPGSAKSMIAKSSGKVLSKKVITVPSNISEGDLFGGADTEASIKEGRIVSRKGLLNQAHGNVIAVDDINLMDRKVLYGLLDSVINKRVDVEREGVSLSYCCDAILIATATFEESEMPSHLLDRFDLCVHTKPFENNEEKIEILKRMDEFSNDSEKFTKRWKSAEDTLVSDISRASKILPHVVVSDEHLTIMVELCERMNVDGHRGDAALFRASKALASMAGRDEVLTEDVERAAIMCLAHRRKQVPFTPDEPPPVEQNNDNQSNESKNKETPENTEPETSDAPDDEESKDDPDDNSNPPAPPMPDLEDIVFNVGEQFKVIDYLTGRPERISKSNADKGKRKRAVSTDGSGRYSNNEVPKDRLTDLALDATIRAAAPYQQYRESNGLAIMIEKQDLRKKIREKRTGATIMFVVDASGSLGVRKRMETVKGAILSLLRDSYVKRDKIGMMAFRRTTTELILPPTHSAEYGYKKLKELPTGGKTPLSDAIGTATEFMSSYSRSHVGERCHIVLITDGRANVPLTEGKDANEEVLQIAEKAAVPGLRWTVIDASSGYLKFDNARRLAERLGAMYFNIENLNADKLVGSVRMAAE